MTEHTYVTLKDAAKPETKPSRTLHEIELDIVAVRRKQSAMQSDIVAMRDAQSKLGEEIIMLRHEFRTTLDALFPGVILDRK